MLCLLGAFDTIFIQSKQFDGLAATTLTQEMLLSQDERFSLARVYMDMAADLRVRSCYVFLLSAAVLSLLLAADISARRRRKNVADNHPDMTEGLPSRK